MLLEKMREEKRVRERKKKNKLSKDRTWSVLAVSD